MHKVFTIFVGSSGEAKDYANKIVSHINEHPLFQAIPWWHEEVFPPCNSFLESLFNMLPRTTFGIFIATPDDLLMKRDAVTPTIRDNVLFEYGLFAGRLGRRNAILVTVGLTDVPSDLEGIVYVQVKNNGKPEYITNELHNAANKCLDAFINSCHKSDFAISEILDLGDYLDEDIIKPILTKTMVKKVKNLSLAGVPHTYLESILSKYRSITIKEVGLKAKQLTKLTDFIDFQSVEPEELKQLSATFARFVAKHMLKPYNKVACATRVAIHNKKDLKFISAVIARMQIRPVIIDLESKFSDNRLKGRYFRGEHAIFLHDFTTSGFTPLECIQQLRQKGIHISKIVSFFVREDNLEKLQKHCADSEVDFQVFCVCKKNGTIKYQGDQE